MKNLIFIGIFALMNSQEIDNLLKIRFGGSVNIRGIRYQILYSLLRSFDLYKEQNKQLSIQLEGIEDLDLKGFNFKDEYIQVKTSEKSWSWYQLKDPLSNYIKAYRLNPESIFSLIVNFDLTSDIAKLANFRLLPKKDRIILEKKFKEICLKAGGNKSEVKDLIEKISIKTVKEIDILTFLSQSVAENFSLSSEAVEVYILVLIGKFLEWSKDRKVININDLEFIKAQVGEALSRESDFQAYGRSLINKVTWTVDANENDYFEGKRTRTGHISSGLDVHRSVWLERIDKAINNSRICILRSSSGQGKSSLMFRYAYENWSAENTFCLQVVETYEQAEKVCNYLSFRSSLGLPVLLLIDNAGWKTKYWSLVTGKCAELGIYVLMTTRNEDWFRFSDESLTNFEILEPELNLEEAINIFNTFKQRQKINLSVESPEWAFEKIGEPHLLIEYVYLITHGEMLQDRLKEQIKQISKQGEDPAKIEILRKSSLAHALGVPVIASKLLKEINLIEDPHQVLKSVVDEYITLDNGFISGLHWVRSNHLVQLLHDTFPDTTVTALSLISSVSPEYMSLFISNVLSREDINKEEFLESLIGKAKKLSLKDINKIVIGIFEAGEKQFFFSNKKIFDEAHSLAGVSGISIFSTEFLPIIKLDYINSLINIIKDHKADNLRFLKDLSTKSISVNRGLNLVSAFLKNILPHLQSNQLKNDMENTGILLDWCYLCQIKLPLWEKISKELINKRIFDLSIESFCRFTQGFYRYDEKSYMKWYHSNNDEIFGYLKLNLDCIKLEIKDNVLSFEFIPENSKEPNDQLREKLDSFRASLPFCDKYCSQGFYPKNFKPSVDSTISNVDKEKLFFITDAKKNKIWLDITTKTYSPDSYYKYQKIWFEFRKDFLSYAKNLSTFFQSILTGTETSHIENELIIRVSNNFKKVPNPPLQTPEMVSNIMKDIPNSWKIHLQNFFSQSLSFLEDNNKINDRRLSIHNLKDTIKHLPEMHQAFTELFKISPDYFNLKSLNNEELKVYPLVAELYEIWAFNPPKTKINNILSYIHSEKDWKRTNLISKLKNSFEALESQDIKIIYPFDIHLDFPLKYLILAFTVKNPFNYNNELFQIISTLSKIKEISDYFYLIPIHDGKRFNTKSHRYSSNSITEILEGNITSWETMLPVEPPENLLKTLPDIPFKILPELDYPVKVFSLLMNFNFIIEQINYISILKDQENRFEKELYLKHKKNLISQIKNLLDEFAEAKDIIPSEFFSEYQINIQWLYLENLLKNKLENEYNQNFYYEQIFDYIVNNLNSEVDI